MALWIIAAILTIVFWPLLWEFMKKAALAGVGLLTLSPTILAFLVLVKWSDTGVLGPIQIVSFVYFFASIAGFAYLAWHFYFSVFFMDDEPRSSIPQQQQMEVPEYAKR